VAAAESAADALAAMGIQATLINARFIKPADDDLILEAAARCGCLVTIEENVIAGGFGSRVLELLSARCIEIPAITLGVADRIYEQASQKRLREIAGLAETDIVAAAIEVRSRRSPALAGNREASAAM
jgi:1-deoxy-D-xylulose-5-phosphate synthase